MCWHLKCQSRGYVHLRTVLLRLVTSQFQDIVNHKKIKVNKTHILRFVGSKFCVKFERRPLKVHKKIWTQTAQNVHFTRCSKCYIYITVMTPQVLVRRAPGPLLTSPPASTVRAVKLDMFCVHIFGYHWLCISRYWSLHSMADHSRWHISILAN